MSNDQTGPWVLALGTLAVGVAAIGAELLRRRGGGGDEEHPETDNQWAVERGPERR